MTLTVRDLVTRQYHKLHVPSAHPLSWNGQGGRAWHFPWLLTLYSCLGIILSLPQKAIAPVPTVIGSAVSFATMRHTVLVHAVLNHQEPVTLLLDTGATHTLLTPDITRRLGISLEPNAPRNSMATLGSQEGVTPLTQVSPVAWQHINLCGRYEFTQEPETINLEAIIQALAEVQITPEEFASTS